MKRKTLLAAALAAGSLMGLASVAQAVPAVVATPGTYYNGTTVYTAPGTTVYSTPVETVTVATAPPAPLYEAVPAPREGYVWAPGHYSWRHGQYVWTPGEWMASRPGFAWQAAHWEQRSDGVWYLVGGTWVRNDRVATNEERRERLREERPWGDRDHDGVPNRYDNHPFDPTRN